MPCKCGSDDGWILTDAKGIYVAKVCDKCEDEVKARYNPWVFSGYDQSDCDEPIDEDPEVGRDW